MHLTQRGRMPYLNFWALPTREQYISVAYLLGTLHLLLTREHICCIEAFLSCGCHHSVPRLLLVVDDFHLAFAA